MAKTYSDFSQLSKGMFRKSDPVVEVKPLPKTRASDDEALAYFGLTGRGGREDGSGGQRGAGLPGAFADSPGDAAYAALKARLEAAEAKASAIDAERGAAERKAGELERQLAAERAARQAAEGERDRLRGEVLRLRNELEEALTAPDQGNGRQETESGEPPRQVSVDGLLKPPNTEEVFEGEVREHVLAALSEARDAAVNSLRERRRRILEDVLAVNEPSGELVRRRGELRQIIKDTGSFVDTRAMSRLERLGFRCVSGNKHWKLDYADVRIPMSKTPSDRRAALNTAASIAGQCF